MQNRNEKVANEIKELAALFLERESNRTSLLTVTGCSASSDLKRATLFVSVLPVSEEAKALEFVRRNLGGLRKSLKEKIPMKTIPFLEVKLDQGEKNRQKIDELSRK